MGISDMRRFDIQFHFHGKTIVLKVTKFSTCDDVIHMVLHKFGLPVTKVMLYAVFERTCSTERMLGNKTLVYKVWRSWGCESKHFEFHIRSKETKLGIKSKISDTGAEGCIDQLFLEQYNRKAETQKRHTSCRARTRVTFNVENDNSQNIVARSQKQSVSTGKQIVLARYLYDLFTRSSKKKKIQTEAILRRECADGAENEDGNGSASSDKGSSQREKCRYIWYKNYETDSESEADELFSETSSDNSFDLYHDETITMDTAFLKSSRDSDSDEGIDVTSVTSSDLDTAFIGDFENKSFFNTCDSKDERYRNDTEDSSARENAFEMNISNDKFLKDLFGKAGKEAVSCEDDEMDSFMRSRLDSF